MRAFTLLELVVVLAIISVLLALSFPAFYSRSFNSPELFENRVRSLFESAFTFGKAKEVCVDFKREELSVGKEKVELPYPAESLVVPGKVISGELFSRYCFEPSGFTYFTLNLKKEDGYLTLFTLFPSGETQVLNLKESEEETLKDKVEKGRITQWFSYYSY